MRRFLTPCLFVAIAVCADAAHAAETGKIGRWTIDLARSRFPGTPPADDLRSYDDAGDGLLRSTHVVTNADGSTSVTVYAARDDGREYPMQDGAGNPAGTIALTIAGPRTQAFVTRRGGKVVAQGRTVVSADARTLTIRLRLPERPPTEYRMVYRRVGEQR